VDKVPAIPDTIVIDWEAMTKSLEEGDGYKGPPIEIKIDLNLIDQEVEDAMKCVAIVPERKKLRKGL